MPFQINVTLSIDPPEIKEQIEACFDRAYRGERGSGESAEHFVARKLESFVLSLYESQERARAAEQAAQLESARIMAEAQIRQRIDLDEAPEQVQA